MSQTPNPAATTRVAIVDDHRLLRTGLEAELRAAADLEVVASLESVERLLAHSGVPPQVVLLDLDLPGGLSGTEAVRAVVQLGYAVLVVTAERDPHRLLAAIQAGARGWLDKSSDGSAIASTVRAIARGEVVIPQLLARQMASEARTMDALKTQPALLDTLRLLALGMGDQQIATRRSVSVKTVKTQIAQIRDIFENAGRGRPPREDLENLGRRLHP